MKYKQIYFRLLLLFPLTTLLQGGILENINKILFALIMLVQISLQVYYRSIKKQYIPIYILVIVNYIWSCYISSYPLRNVNNMFYFIFFALTTLFIVESKYTLLNYLQSDKRFILFLLRVWNLLVGISIFLPSSYAKNDMWGEKEYFVSYTDSVFRLAPAALMILSMALICIILYKKKRYMVYSLVPLYCFYEGGSRTYLGIGLVMFMLILYICIKNKKRFYATIIPLTVVFGLLIGVTAAGDKLESTKYSAETSNFGFLGTFTSGRTEFWMADLKAFNEQPLADKIMGCGFDFVYEASEKYYTSAHWAHNDFLGMLLNYGYVGVILYMFCIGALMKPIMNKKVALYIKGSVLFIWLINAFFNMFYTYNCAFIGFIFMISMIDYCYHKEEYDAYNIEFESKQHHMETPFSYGEAIKL